MINSQLHLEVQLNRFGKLTYWEGILLQFIDVGRSFVVSQAKFNRSPTNPGQGDLSILDQQISWF